MPKYHGGYKRGQNSPLTGTSNKNTTEENVTRHCHDCNRTGTPQWREGPDGPKTLCNACGVKRQRLRRGPRPAAAAAVLDAPRLPSQRLARNSKRTRLSETSDDEQERLSGHDDTGNEDDEEDVDQDMAVLNLLCFAKSSDAPHKRRRGAGMGSQVLSEFNARFPTNINPLQAAMLQCTSLPEGTLPEPESVNLHQMYKSFQGAWVKLTLAKTAQVAAEETLLGADQGLDTAREACILISSQLSDRLSNLAQQANNALARLPPAPPPVNPLLTTNTLNLIANNPNMVAYSPNHIAHTFNLGTNTLNLALPHPPAAELERVTPAGVTFNLAQPTKPVPSTFALQALSAFAMQAPHLALQMASETHTNSGTARHLPHNNAADDANNHVTDGEDNSNRFAAYNRALGSNAYNGSNLGNNPNIANNGHNLNLNTNLNVNNLQGLAELMLPLHHQFHPHHHASNNATNSLHLGGSNVRMANAGHSHDHASAMDAIAMGVIV